MAVTNWDLAISGHSWSDVHRDRPFRQIANSDTDKKKKNIAGRNRRQIKRFLIESEQKWALTRDDFRIGEWEF
jgi:hypothetical protein